MVFGRSMRLYGATYEERRFLGYNASLGDCEVHRIQMTSLLTPKQGTQKSTFP